MTLEELRENLIADIDGLNLIEDIETHIIFEDSWASSRDNLSVRMVLNSHIGVYAYEYTYLASANDTVKSSVLLLDGAIRAIKKL